MRKVKYLTKGLLIIVAEEGEQHDFNRQIDPDVLDDVTDERMPVEFCMTHRHARGIPVSAHARCSVTLRTKHDIFPFTTFLDMTFVRYEGLPTFEIEDEEVQRCERG